MLAQSTLPDEHHVKFATSFLPIKSLKDHSLPVFLCILRLLRSIPSSVGYNFLYLFVRKIICHFTTRLVFSTKSEVFATLAEFFHFRSIKFSYYLDMEDLGNLPQTVSKRTLACSECGKVFKSKYSLMDHEVEKHGRLSRYSCFVCEKGGQKCSSKASLRRHTIRHTGQRPYKCGTCEKGFFDKQVRRIHERIHQDTFEFQCKHCEKQFHQSHQLVAHTKRHNGVRNSFIQFQSEI